MSSVSKVAQKWWTWVRWAMRSRAVQAGQLGQGVVGSSEARTEARRSLSRVMKLVASIPCRYVLAALSGQGLLRGGATGVEVSQRPGHLLGSCVRARGTHSG